MASSVGLERGAPLAWPLAWPGACVAGVWDTDADGFRREFVAKVIVVDPCASEPPACRGADYVWAAKDEPDHAVEATSLRTDGTYAARRKRRLGRGA